MNRYCVRVSCFILLCFAGFSAQNIFAQTSQDFAVPMSAVVKTTPPSITLHWLGDAKAKRFEISRRPFSAEDWTLLATMKGTDTAYTDLTVAVGENYEYMILKPFTSGTDTFPGLGYLNSGIAIPLRDQLGTVILIVDNTMSVPLKSELARLQQDLIGDGWKVIRHDVSRNDSVPFVKALIMADYKKDTKNTRSVFLFGHVPVPYSGELNPDAHPNHKGAWPADVYYGNLNGIWTDKYVKNDTVQAYAWNRNHPGDGKFDQSILPAAMDLEVGRVDLSNMTAWTPTETELLRKYLNKDHAFRTGAMTAPARGMIADNFGAILGKNDAEAFAADGWRSFSGFFGIQNATIQNWFGTLDTAAYLCAYGCGGGSLQSCGGIGVSTDFVTKDCKAIFTMLFGSYFGDWDNENNFLRAPLTSSLTLTSCWAGRPHWVFHPFGLGETMGYCARLSEDSSTLYVPIDDGINLYNAASTMYGGYSYVSAELLGDPTLKLKYSPMVATSIAALQNGGASVSFTWTTPTKPVLGYNVYRAPTSNGPFTKLNATLLKDTTYSDIKPYGDSDFYMVRPVELVMTASGSYYQAGQGMVVSVYGAKSGVGPMARASQEKLSVRESYAGLEISLDHTNSSSVKLSIFDITGREIANLQDGQLAQGAYHFAWDHKTTSGSIAPTGVYIVRVVEPDYSGTAKFAIVR
ncbi:MAG: FlgD immunoglobulin-like domain containing protein [Candidatus Kapaibacterium sp.]